MLHAIAALDGQGKVAGRALADPDDVGTLVLARQEFLGISSGDTTVVPVVGFHLYVVTRD